MDIFQVREALVSFPQETAHKLSAFWGKVQNSWFESAEAEEVAYAQIVQESGVTQEMVDAFYHWVYEVTQPYSVKVFYRDGEYVAGKPCFEYRCDAEYLPKATIVCVLISYDGVIIHEPPSMNDTQKEEFRSILQEVLLYYSWEITVDQLLKEKLIKFQ